MRFLLYFILLLSFSVSTLINADGFYKWKDARGVTQYGDEPPSKAHAKKFKLPKITILQDYGSQWTSPELNPPVPPLTKKTSPVINPYKKIKQVIHYASLTFIAPKEGQLVQADNGDVTAIISIKPKLDLKKGHRFRFSLDGKSSNLGISRFANFSDLSSGSHTLRIDILAKNGEVIQQSKTLSFHVAR